MSSGRKKLHFCKLAQKDCRYASKIKDDIGLVPKNIKETIKDNSVHNDWNRFPLCGHDHKAQITLKKRHLFSRSAFERKRTTTICRYITIVAWTSLESKMEIKQATLDEVVNKLWRSGEYIWCCNNCPRDRCPRRQLSKGLLSNDIVVQADYCPRRLLSKE